MNFLILKVSTFFLSLFFIDLGHFPGPPPAFD